LESKDFLGTYRVCTGTTERRHAFGPGVRATNPSYYLRALTNKSYLKLNDVDLIECSRTISWGSTGSIFHTLCRNPQMARSRATVGRAKPPARHFDVAQVLRGVPAVRLSSAGAGNGASFGAFRQHTRVRLLPALRSGLGGTCSSCLSHQAGELAARCRNFRLFTSSATWLISKTVIISITAVCIHGLNPESTS
jgi:hypothetical protein